MGLVTRCPASVTVYAAESGVIFYEIDAKYLYVRSTNWGLWAPPYAFCITFSPITYHRIVLLLMQFWQADFISLFQGCSPIGSCDCRTWIHKRKYAFHLFRWWWCIVGRQLSCSLHCSLAFLRPSMLEEKTNWERKFCFPQEMIFLQVCSTSLFPKWYVILQNIQPSNWNVRSHHLVIWC